LITKKETTMNIATFPDLAALPTTEIGNLHRANLPHEPAPTKKSVACHDLAAHCARNGLSLADLRSKLPAAPAAPDLSEVTKAVDVKVNDLLGQINTQGNELGRRLSLARDAIANIVKDNSSIRVALDSMNEKAQAAIDAVAARPVVEVPKAEIDALITRTVMDAFGAFKSQVVAARAEAVVADLAVAAAACQILDAESVFGLRVADAKGQTMSLTHWHRPDAPAIDACFVWTPDILRHLLLASSATSTLANIWLGGEKGAGKSETARQWAARTGRAFTRINFQRFTTVEDFLGATSLQAGSTAFEAGPFLKAYSTPGSVILLDEITNADPGVLNALNGFLEPGAAVTFGGKVWSKAPGVMILAADNTLGNGDQTGRYAGTRAQGAPLLNRFGQVVHLTFLPRPVEQEAVVKRTGCTDALAGYVLDAIGVARSKVQDGEIIDAPSIRNVMAFIEALRVLPVRAAWDSTIAAAQPAESAVALQSVFESCISETTINQLI
jgi:MoxR-like ATPase